MTCAVEMKRGRKLDVWWPVEAKQKKVKASMRPLALKRRVEYPKTLRNHPIEKDIIFKTSILGRQNVGFRGV